MLAARSRLFAGGVRPETLARFAVPVNALLVVLLAYALAQLSWSLIPQPRSAVTASVKGAAALPHAALGATGADYATIADWHLFGRVDAAMPVAQQVVAAPETKLNLRLAGVFYTGDGGRPLALISAGGGEDLSYTIGSQLPGGAQVQQILRDRVVLSRNGRLETLSLPEESEADGGAGALPLLEQVSPQGSAPDGADSGPTTVDAGPVVERFRDAMMNEPQSLQDLAFVTPYVRSGQFMGYRLRPGRDPQVFEQLGLRPGDVITAINGARLDDPGQGLRLLQDAINADQMSVQVLRGGVEIPFTFMLNAPIMGAEPDLGAEPDQSLGAEPEPPPDAEPHEILGAEPQ